MSRGFRRSTVLLLVGRVFFRTKRFFPRPPATFGGSVQLEIGKRTLGLVNRQAYGSLADTRRGECRQPFGNAVLAG